MSDKAAHVFQPDPTAREIEPNVATADIGCAVCGKKAQYHNYSAPTARNHHKPYVVALLKIAEARYNNTTAEYHEVIAAAFAELAEALGVQE